MSNLKHVKSPPLIILEFTKARGKIILKSCIGSRDGETARLITIPKRGNAAMFKLKDHTFDESCMQDHAKILVGEINTTTGI